METRSKANIYSSKILSAKNRFLLDIMKNFAERLMHV